MALKDKDYEFSINLTVEDILDEDLNEYLILKITEFNVANKLVLELVESEKITTYEPVYAFINKFKSMGCKIAIDDFGSGYSNFEYLLKIDADFVKIDGSIIRRIIENENSLEIVKSIIIFCKKMGIKTIAEFICDEALLEKVSELELDFSQGFYIGKPKENIDE